MVRFMMVIRFLYTSSERQINVECNMKSVACSKRDSKLRDPLLLALNLHYQCLAGNANALSFQVQIL